MKKQIHNQLKELAVTILNEQVLSVDEIKEKALKIYEQAIVFEYAEKNGIAETPIPLLVKEDEPSIVSIPKTDIKTDVIEHETPISLIPKVSENKEEVSLTISENKEEALPTFEIEEGVLGMTFEASEAIEDVQKIEQPKAVTTAVETEDIPTEAPALLHELENLTKDFDLPDFEPMEATKVVETEKPSEIINTSKSKTSLNDTLNKGFHIGLNDRLAFVNQLFGGSQQDYTRVISQLNTVENLGEAQQFINEIVKPEYNNWEGKEAFEIRFLDLVERNFQA